MDEHRERIRHLLAATTPAMLPGKERGAPERFTKAGILPFLPAAATENWHFLLMQPVAMHPERGAPRFQMAKGTRMQKIGGAWQDIRGDVEVTGEPETLIETALREGEEELGLDITRISRLFDVGAVRFTSVKMGTEKSMWLFAAEMHGADCLLEEVASTTGQRMWLPWPSVRTHARADHVTIITSLLPALARAVK